MFLLLMLFSALTNASELNISCRGVFQKAEITSQMDYNLETGEIGTIVFCTKGKNYLYHPRMQDPPGSDFYDLLDENGQPASKVPGGEATAELTFNRIEVFLNLPSQIVDLNCAWPKRP